MPEPGLPKPTVPTGSYLGFDFGLRRIGIATGNSTTVTAMPISAAGNHNGTLEWELIDELVEEWRPAALVVGRPLRLDDSEQLMTREADGFIKRLKKRYRLPVFATDERGTSIEASAVIKKNRQFAQSGKTTKTDIDKIAAALLLQRWLDEHFHASPGAT